MKSTHSLYIPALFSLFLTAAGCSGGSGGSNVGSSGDMAIDVSKLTAGGFEYTQGSYLLGFEFKATSAISVPELGYWDSNLEGSAKETFAPTPVGLYDLTTSTLLGSVTVSAADPAEGLYRFHALTSPITLNATDTYAVVAVTGTNYYVAGEGASCVGGFYCSAHSVNSSITVLGAACLGNDNECLETTDTLEEPDATATWINLGPNFTISAAAK